MNTYDNSIFLLPNFIDDNESKNLILAMERMLLLPNLIQRKSFTYKRDTVPFGIDHGDESNADFNGVPEYYQLILDLSNKIIKQIKTSFNEKNDIYLSALSFSKQHPGSFIPKHDDTDSDINSHIDYSAIIYLNTINGSGSINFLDFDYSLFPEAGSLLIFDSKSTGFHEVLKTSETRYTIPIWLTKNKEYSLF